MSDIGNDLKPSESNKVYSQDNRDAKKGALMSLLTKDAEYGGRFCLTEKEAVEIVEKLLVEGKQAVFGGTAGCNKSILCMLVGMALANDEDEVSDIQEIDKTAVQKQLVHLSELKANRNKDEVQISLADLKKTAAGDGNLMPLIIRAVIAHATLGEISDTLRSVFGEY